MANYRFGNREIKQLLASADGAKGAPQLSGAFAFKECVIIMNSKKKAILDRIQHLEDSIIKGREYLESGQHAHWYGFRPLFFNKIRDGEILPPHKDWIRNVFLPRTEKALRKAQETLEKLN